MRSPRLPAPQWVKYDPCRIMVETAAVSPLAELAHRRLADTVWASGRWPKFDVPPLLPLIRVTSLQWPGVLIALRHIGWHLHRKTLHHHGVQEVLRAATTAQAAASESGRKAANTRWNAPPPPTDPPDAQRIADAVPAHGAAQMPAQMRAQCERNADKIKIKNKESLAFNAERLTLSVSTRKAGAGPEKEFLAEVSETFAKTSPKTAKAELVNWGGWWRNRFREDPAKARRVLAEIHSMIKEHRILDNPGAAAGDLWKRLP